METPIAHSRSGSRDFRVKRYSADQTHASSSSNHHPSSSPGSHRHSSAILASRIRPFHEDTNEATEEAGHTSLEGGDAATDDSTDSSPDQTPRGSPENSPPGTPQTRHMRLMSYDQALNRVASRQAEYPPAIVQTMHPPIEFHIDPLRPLLLSTTIAQRKGFGFSIASLPPPSKYDKIYKSIERDPWQAELAKLFEASQINNWKTLVLDRKGPPAEGSEKQPPSQRRQCRRRHVPAKDELASSPHAETSSEDGSDFDRSQANAPSRVNSTPRPEKSVESDAFDRMYEQYQTFYIEKRKKKKAQVVKVVDNGASSPPQVVVNEAPIGGLGRTSLRGRAFTSFIPPSRSYGTSTAGVSGSGLSSEPSSKDEPPRPDTPGSMSDTDYVADLSCPETPRKARRQTRTMTKGVLTPVSDYGEDLHSSSPRSSLDNTALTTTNSRGSGSRGEDGTVAPVSRVNNTSSADREGLHSHSPSLSKSRKHTSVLPFGRKSTRHDREQEKEAKQFDTTSVSVSSPASPPAPARSRQIALPPMGAAWVDSLMPSPIIPSAPPSRPRKSTGSGKTISSGSSKTASSKEKEKEKDKDKEKEGGRSKRRMLPRLGLGGGGGRTSLDPEGERERVEDCPEESRDSEAAVSRAGDAAGDAPLVDSHDQERDRAELCSSPAHDHDHYLTDSTPRCSSTLPDYASAVSSGPSFGESVDESIDGETEET
ncbi:hypothetical protein BCV69DRAFT_279415 [Microstroma glucosiphilum]|uniref:Uncharacterized protein n=1 Tax=Pseudomicrostroma glucosiphilum TaxID=1684307 RepID=A0A316UE23_9BASI|nr:hypothetical protein BCV69DRAFT_279415 [Pseudomicrostroma glucosiphilum]PWN23469.1 hypothetical protein BCV69DRAFT_279415 [Pseudomicrostroma glucosiphilum]